MRSPICFGVDIGNSGLRVAELDSAGHELGRMLRINWCLADTGAIRHCGASSDRYQPDDPAWTERLAEFISVLGIGPRQSGPRWLISSVRRDALRVLQNFLQASPQHHVQVIDYTCVPLRIDVEFPQRVGIDRLLAALAATSLTQARPAIVVQAGSAVTVDLLSAPMSPDSPSRDTDSLSPDSPARDHPAISPPTLQHIATFEGGAIVPGVPMMLRLLGKGADQLPEIDADDLLELPRLPGKNTEQAMICGAASALVGGVTHLIDRYRAGFGAEVPVILSGGDGMRLASYIPAPLIVRSHLVQRGLLQLAQLAIV